MKKYITQILFAALFAVVIIPSLTSVQAADQQVDKLKAALPMLSGITIRMTPADPNPREMPWWMGMVFDTTNQDEPTSVAMVAECFQNLPCSKVEVVPQWKFLFQFMSKLNIAFPTAYMSNLDQNATDQYLIANCGQKPAKNFTKNWNFQITAGENAYAYDLSNVYCSNVKTVNTPSGPRVTEYTLTFGKLAQAVN